MMADGWTVDGRVDAHRASPRVYVGEEGGVTLRWWVERLNDAVLEISYEVVNGSTETIFLCTPLAELQGGKAMPDPRKVYRYLDPEGVLHLTKQVWPLPAEVDVYVTERPLLTAVEAQGRFSEQLVVSVPVTISYPYRFTPQVAKAVEEAPCDPSTGLAFSIAFITNNSNASSLLNVRRDTEVSVHKAISVYSLGRTVLVRDAG